MTSCYKGCIFVGYLTNKINDMNTTYTNYDFKVILNPKGVVIESNNPTYKVGEKASKKQLKACGWMKSKKVVTVFANGSKTGQRFL